MLQKAKNILKDQSGQGMAEYGLIIALIAVVVIGAIIFLGGALSDKFEFIGTEIDEAESKYQP